MQSPMQLDKAQSHTYIHTYCVLTTEIWIKRKAWAFWQVRAVDPGDFLPTDGPASCLLNQSSWNLEINCLPPLRACGTIETFRLHDLNGSLGVIVYPERAYTPSSFKFTSVRVKKFSPTRAVLPCRRIRIARPRPYKFPACLGRLSIISPSAH